MPEDAAFHLPEDLSGLTSEELAALTERAAAEFDTIHDTEGGPRTADLPRAAELADAYDKLTSETQRRTQASVDAAAQFEALRARVHRGPAGGEGTELADGGEPDAGEPDGDVEPAEPAPVTAAARGKTPVEDVIRRRPKLNPSLSDAQRSAPKVAAPARSADLAIVAASATADAAIGSQFTDLDALGKAVTSYARGMATSHGNPSYVPLATVRNSYDVVLDERTNPAHVEARFREMTARGRSAADFAAMVAAGGWCAPSENRYSFFNIACEDGRVDLPTFGVERGGVKWPVSPSLASVFTNPGAFAPFGATFSVSSVPWLWTEGSDILAATGSPTKPCIRVPCPTFDEARLECYGICLTVGNLTDNAFPESTRNTLALLMSAHYHASNLRYLATMSSLSTLSTPASGIGAAGSGVAAPLLGAVELAAIDYRTKYGMCEGDVLEVILPIWAKGAVRSDLAKRTGCCDMLAVTDAQIAEWFDRRGVRVQFVADYQVRTAGLPGVGDGDGLTAWPTAVEFMIYAAGTFMLGNGMSLDLGVVRDSTLNALNDHTAAWMEECHLIAKFGHESRRYIVNICTDGTTGAADLTACGL